MPAGTTRDQRTEERGATITRDAVRPARYSGTLISLLLLLSVWGNWRAMAWVALGHVVIAVWNTQILRIQRLGFFLAEDIRAIGNAGITVVIGHFTGWTLPNFLWFPTGALLEEGESLGALRRPAMVAVVVSTAAMVEGTPPLIPLCFVGLATIAYLFTNARKKLIFSMLRMSDAQQAALSEKNAELRELPRRIQRCVLPKQTTASFFTVSARMLAAEDVGGDYYDVLPAPGGAWIAVGDVSGHGLQAGLIMFMLQSAVASLTAARPDAKPSEIVTLLNTVMYDNIRNRLGSDDHVTFVLLRLFDDGRVLHAGSHEELIIRRARGKLCETVATHGTWLGAMSDVRRVTVDSRLQLEPGDLLVVYTDGLVESRSGTGELFGLDRLCDQISALGLHSMDEDCDQILANAQTWSPSPQDDMSLVLIRFEGVTSGKVS